MFAKIHPLIIILPQLIVGIGLTIVSLIVVIFQFRPESFPVPPKEKIWRSILVALTFPVGILGILFIVNVFTDKSIFTSIVLIPVFCITLPIVMIATGVSTYLQFGWLARIIGKFNIEKKKNGSIESPD